MVDARLTPLAAMGLDRGALMRDGLRLHSGVVYPGIRALPTEKNRDGSGLPLSYGREGLPELMYKPDGSMDSRKPTNGYLGLYKAPPPGLHKPVLMSGAGADGLGLERRAVGHGEKPSELSLVGAGGSYLRVPWISPYSDTNLYPFMDTSKYALSMYKASFLGQPSPYLPQHLAYQSLCAAQGGNVNPAAAERLYYMPQYPPSSISSPLVPPPMRIGAVTVAPTSLVHCQEKGLTVGPRFPPEGSPFGQQLHQPSLHSQHQHTVTDRDRSPSRSSKPNRPPSRKDHSNNSNNSSGTSGGNSSSLPVDSSPRASSRLPQPPPPPPPTLIDTSLDLQRPVPRIVPPPASSTSSISTSSSSSSSSQSMPHLFPVSSMVQEHPSPARPSPHKPRPRDGSVGSERRPSRSPSKPGFDRPAHQLTTTKEPTEKPLDLSGRMLEFGLPPNGFPVKMDALAPALRYGLPPSRELLKETLSLSPPSLPHTAVSSTSSKASERPEIISTLHSSWVVPTPSPSHAQHTPGPQPSPRPTQEIGPPQAKGSSPSVIKHKGLDRVLPQQRSSSCPRIGEPNHTASSTQHSASSLVNSRPLSPKPNGDWARRSPSQSEHHREGAEKSSQASKKNDTTAEVTSYKRPCLESSNPPGHLYLPESEAYLNSLAYANRYLHYSIPDGMALHSLPLPGKGPVYPHPVLLGSNSLYPSHLAPKHPLPYHNLPTGHGGEFLTFNSQEMAHPLMQPHPDAKPQDKGDTSLKSRGQEKLRGPIDACSGHTSHSSGDKAEGGQTKPDREAGEQGGSHSKPPSSSAASKEKIVCIDLVHSETDVESNVTPTVDKHASPVPGTRVNQNECCHGNQNQTKTECEPKLPSHPHPVHPGQSSTLKPDHADRERETPSWKPRLFQDTGCPRATSRPPPSSPGQASRAEESPEEWSPSADLGEQDQSTLRCARTSGERTSGQDKWNRERQVLPHAAQHRAADPGNDGREHENVQGRESAQEDSIVDPEESHEEGDEDECGGAASRASRRSSLAKRIANSSGYVGDRFKCVTTELYADSSKLSREQRALQMEVISREESNISQPAAKWERAMLRFSELELKEKEGGGLCVSASAVGRELAGGQRKERELEHCQHTTRQAEREGSGEPPVYSNNRVPVLQRCGSQREPLSSGQEARYGARGAGQGAPRDAAREPEGGHCSPPTLAPADGHLYERAGVGHGRARKRPLCPEEGREAGERAAHLEKKAKLFTADVGQALCHEEEEEDVGKLRVCIELKGLRLSKPGAGAASPDALDVKQERLWPPPPRGLARALSPRDRRFRDLEEKAPPTLQRAEVNRKWGCEKLVNGVAASQLAPHLAPITLKDRTPPQGPYSGDRGPKEPKRAPASPLLPDSSVGDSPPLKLRRHSDADKPKGKRPCKTKHTSQKERERERKKEIDHRCAADPESTAEDKPAEQQRSAPGKRDASPTHYPGSPVKPRSPAAPRPSSLQQPPANGKGTVPPEGAAVRRTPPADSPVVRPIPPEARRLIVNKNAGETLLQRAARLGYEEVVLYCLENRVCEVNHRDYAGYCALHEACARGWLSIVQHLLEHGADINCSAQDGTRPLHDAVENDHLDVVRVLLSYGADPTLATYSGRGLLKMTHSDSMERFLTDYFADLQGRSDDDPGLYWEFYGSAVCESAEEGAAFDILADPPGPEEEEEEEDRKEMFEFEFSDRPLLPCYNIQVSLSQGPRNWLLLSDVLRRLRMSARNFRSAFPHMEVVTVAEAEFYRQASLSQLFSCPDELEGFQPDSKELLDLVEGSAELAAMLGSSLECLDRRWDRPGDKLKDRIMAVDKLVAS